MDSLTGNPNVDGDNVSPGLLNHAEGGVADSGGTIYLDFALTSTQEFTYAGDKKSNSVGTLRLRISVSNIDTEETVLKKINDALNSSTILDLSLSADGAKNTRQIVDRSWTNSSLVERDVYRIDETYGNVNINIHAGPTTIDKVLLKYQTLRLGALGLADTNVLTQDNATNAITEVANALKVVSEQRALFGSYQNHMEHAYAINKNTEENTTTAESRIRDTDMAEEMVEFSKTNILAQAGQSMLAQTNTSSQGVLSLLQ